MPLTAFDHVNIRTHRLEEMMAWYDDILGLSPGERPDFPFPGAWLYLGDQAMVHLVGVDAPTAPPENLSLEHAAFRATGLKTFIAHLEAKGVPYDLARVPGLPIVQVNTHDPDGNHLHIDFDAAEA